jgi:hypothetical protein
MEVLLGEDLEVQHLLVAMINSVLHFKTTTDQHRFKTDPDHLNILMNATHHRFGIQIVVVDLDLVDLDLWHHLQWISLLCKILILGLLMHL